jgi:hypothetical protein
MIRGIQLAPVLAIMLLACGSATVVSTSTQTPSREPTASGRPEAPVEAEPVGAEPVYAAPEREAPSDPAPQPPADAPTAEPTNPDPPAAAPNAKRWSADEGEWEPFGYVCGFYGGGKPRCAPSRLAKVAAWTLKTTGHRDANKADRLVLYRRRGPVVPVRGAPLPPARPIASSGLLIRELVSDGTYWYFIELDGWLLEATSCSRHADRARADLIEWATRVATTTEE